MAFTEIELTLRWIKRFLIRALDHCTFEHLNTYWMKCGAETCAIMCSFYFCTKSCSRSEHSCEVLFWFSYVLTSLPVWLPRKVNFKILGLINWKHLRNYQADVSSKYQIHHHKTIKSVLPNTLSVLEERCAVNPATEGNV